MKLFLLGGIALLALTACRADGERLVVQDFSECPLCKAAADGNLDGVEFFLDSGMNPNTADSKGITALMRASKSDHPAVVVMLLNAGARLNAVDKSGSTALFWAAGNGSLEAATILLHCGADPSRRNRQNLDAWHWASRQPLMSAVFRRHIAEVRAGKRIASCKKEWSDFEQSPSGEIATANSPKAVNVAERVFENSWQSVVVVKRGDMQGSGVIIYPNVVATNCHVVNSYGRIVIYKHDNRRATTDTIYPAVIRKRDDDKDFCLLDVANLRGKSAKVRRYDTLNIGEDVYAVGSPRGLDLSLSSGIISQLRQGGGERYIQTDASVSPGSSGGGLFDSDGNLIGILTAKIADEDVEGIGFAIPADLAAGL